MQLEVDSDMPHLYGFITEKYMVHPTNLAMTKQYVKITVKPDTSSQRNFTLTIGGRYFQSSELEQMEAQNWDQQTQSQRQQQKQQRQQKSLFDYLWSQDGQQQSQPEPVSTQK